MAGGERVVNECPLEGDIIGTPPSYLIGRSVQWTRSLTAPFLEKITGLRKTLVWRFPPSFLPSDGENHPTRGKTSSRPPVVNWGCVFPLSNVDVIVLPAPPSSPSLGFFPLALHSWLHFWVIIIYYFSKHKTYAYKHTMTSPCQNPICSHPRSLSATWLQTQTHSNNQKRDESVIWFSCAVLGRRPWQSGKPCSRLLYYSLVTWDVFSSVGDVNVVQAWDERDVLDVTAAILIVFTRHLRLRWALYCDAQASDTGPSGKNKHARQD